LIDMIHVIISTGIIYKVTENRNIFLFSITL